MTGITLNGKERGENDRVAEVLTREYGKVRLILPGVRRIRAKLATAVEPLRESRLLVYTPERQQLFPEGAKLTGAEIIQGNWHFLKDPRRYLWAMYLAEITDALLGHNLLNFGQYELFCRTLHLLTITDKCCRIADAYLLRLAAGLGYNFWEYINRHEHELTAQAPQVKKYQTLSGPELLVAAPEVISPGLDEKLFRRINEYLRPHQWYELRSLDLIYENFSGNNF